jgi:hypothetical protein
VLRAAALVLVLVFAAGCGDDRIGAESAKPGKAHRKHHAKPRPWPKRPRCPADASNCASARGTIVYVEAVDPDGDGDAHFVLTSDESITLPGITVIDVEKGLRPHPLPGVGDRVAAAGPVYRGSHGQKQIEATVLRVQRQTR